MTFYSSIYYINCQQYAVCCNIFLNLLHRTDCNLWWIDILNSSYFYTDSLVSCFTNFLLHFSSFFHSFFSGKYFPGPAQRIFANLHVPDVYSKNDTQEVKVIYLIFFFLELLNLILFYLSSKSQLQTDIFIIRNILTFVILSTTVLDYCCFKDFHNKSFFEWMYCIRICILTNWVELISTQSWVAYV